MLVQDTPRLAASRKQRDALDASNQVIGKRRHAKRQFKDYYVGDESTSRQKSESNPDGVAIGEPMAPGLEPPKRACSPDSSMSKGAPNEMVVKESVVEEIVHNGRGARGSSKANPYAKSYGKESAGNNKAGAARVKENGHSTHKGGQHKGGQLKGGSSNTKMSAAEMLAANTRGLNDTNEEVDNTEHEAGETFWRSLIPCFRLICPEDAKALKPKVTQQVPVICAEFSCRVQKEIRCFGSVSLGHITH